jgi:tetratricopeptide (TPR) repeat protein
MKTAVRRDELAILGHRLQTQVQMQFPLRIPLQVRCAIKQHVLVVLAQHQYEVSPNPWRTFEVFEQTIRQSYFDLIQTAIAQPQALAVRLYLRIAGELEPYAADGFDLEPRSLSELFFQDSSQLEIVGHAESRSFAMLKALPSGKVPNAAVAPQSVELPQFVEPQPANSQPTNSQPIESQPVESQLASRLVEPQLVESQPASPPSEGHLVVSSVSAGVEEEIASVQAASTANLDAAEPLLLDLDSDVAQELPHPESTTVSQVPVSQVPVSQVPVSQVPVSQVPVSQVPVSQVPASRFPLPILAMAAAAGLFVLAGSLYALTRPCVIGACVPLQTAQRLSQESTQLVQPNASALDVSEAYQKLAEGSYLLGTIPRWSGKYTEAQALLQVYGTESEVLEQVVAALQTANDAAHASQNPPHPLETWEAIRGQWEAAIALLEQVSTDHPIHPLVQQKLTEYQANLSMISQRIGIEQQAQDKIKLARETARLAEAREGVADSAEGWQLTHVTWQVVVNLLQQIPLGTMAYAEAEQLLAIYQPRLDNARDRRMQEEISANAYSQAVTLAEEARKLEQQNQWSQAVSQWRSALANAQQVPTGTTYHSQIQPLINSYSTSLSTAQETLRSAVAIGSAQSQLEQTCAGTPRVCTFTLTNEVIQVRITPAYDQAVEQAMANSQAAGDQNAQAEIAAYVNALLRALASISESTQVPVELYNADGSVFGTYVPELSGYVTRQAS